MTRDETRDASGRWLPGHSGNAGGSKSTKELRAALASGAADVIDTVLFYARMGDMQAARLVLERLCPPLRASGETVELPELATGDVMTRANAVLTALAEGRVTTDQGEQLLRSLVNVAQLTELEQIKKDIAELKTRDLL